MPIPYQGVGKDAAQFRTKLMLEIVLRHAPDFDAASLEMCSSRHAKYLSLTFTIHATSREQLDNLYREISSHEMVVMVL